MIGTSQECLNVLRIRFQDIVSDSDALEGWFSRVFRKSGCFKQGIPIVYDSMWNHGSGGSAAIAAAAAAAEAALISNKLCLSVINQSSLLEL